MNKEKEIEKLKRLIKCGYLDIDSSIIEAINYILQENKELKEFKKQVKEKKDKIYGECKKNYTLWTKGKYKCELAKWSILRELLEGR